MLKGRLWKCFLIAALCLGALGCPSDAKELLDLALDPPSRRSIDQSRVGVNNFFVNPEFGSIPDQFSEIRDTLGIRFVRVLMAWTTDVQPSPDAEAFYGFYDSIISSIPPGVDVLVVLVHSPSWMGDSANWIDGNPRRTWVERWLRPTVARYAGNPSIIGWEVWNEPDLTLFDSDATFELTDPAKYFELLTFGVEVIRATDPTSLILNAATQSIQQGGGSNLDYNKALVSLGAADIVDIWNIHYYGEQFERVVRDNGVADFLNSLGKTIYITESGETGPSNQLAYVETAWPFLREKVSSIDRIYYYEFGSPLPLDVNFGLRNTDPATRVSDLYVNLRDG